MIHEKYPFEGKTFPELYYRIQNNEPTYNEDLDPDLIKNLQGILTKDPETRFTIADIKNNNWVTKNGTEMLENIDGSECINLCENDFDKAFGKISVNKQRNIRFKAKK